jgi:protein associated with RNAse G/E
MLFLMITVCAGGVMEQNATNFSFYRRCVIKSFKHNGSLHRIWLETWQVPTNLLLSEHAAESIDVFLNEHTVIREADGKEWISRIPAVAFFVPGEWFNVVALLEDKGGIRYYCNIASPPLQYENVLTYIDYDLDVVLHSDGSVHELDWDEFARHRADYRYDAEVLSQVDRGLERLKDRIARLAVPFGDDEVRRYYEEWKKRST